MLSLPSELCCNRIFPLLSICDLQALDSALTCKSLRPRLRKQWKSYRYEPSGGCTSFDDLLWLQNTESVVVGISNMKLDGEDLQFVSTNFPTLVKITAKLCDEEAYNELPQFCQKYQCLQVLQLTMGQLPLSVLPRLSDAGIRTLSRHCCQLQVLALHRFPITDTAIQEICANCPLLRSIGVSYCRKLTYAALLAIVNAYPHLKEIDMLQCKFSDNGLVSFADQCCDLESVAVSFDDTTSMDHSALWTNKLNLIKVNISFNDSVSDDFVVSLVKCCPQLKLLNMCMCRHITDIGIAAVAHHCPSLTALDISLCSNLTSTCLLALGQCCHELESLDISGSAKFIQAGVKALASGCHSLTSFHATTKLIGLAAVIALAKNCPLLSELYLSECTVDDACFYAIAEFCRNLTVLNADSTKIMQAAAIRAVITRCTLLHTLSVRHCDSIQDISSLTILRRSHPRLKRFHVWE